MVDRISVVTLPDSTLARYPVSVSEMRDELGIFGDGSQDDLIEQAIRSGVRYLEELTDWQLSDASVTDFFRSLSKPLLLSRYRGVDQFSDIAVACWETGNNAKKVAPADEYFFDQHGPARIVIKSGSDLLACQLDRLRNYPVEVAYKVSFNDTNEYARTVVNALKVFVNLWWVNREAPTADYRPVEALVAPMVTPVGSYGNV